MHNKDYWDRLINTAKRNNLMAKQYGGYHNLFKEVEKKKFKNVEKKLGIKLSEDFIYITSRTPYDNLYTNYEFGMFNDDKNYNPISDTLECREWHSLPNKYVTLYFKDDIFIIMETIDKYNCKVFVGADNDYYSIIEKGKPIYDDTLTFNSFAEFFEYLLEDEKKIIFEDYGIDVSKHDDNDISE